MTRLPRNVSGRDCIRALEKAGFVQSGGRGSHVTMKRDDPPARTVVPLHSTLKSGMLSSILRQAGLSVDEFVRLL
jgi:predicted RNA binding protein YcfA (HicA-like mRNA interferase family)